MPWRLESHHDVADALHAIGIPDVVDRTVRVCVPAKEALVLGSAQPESDVNVDAAQSLGVDVVRRRSGGGSVLVNDDDIVWIDVLLPRNDALWNDDVEQAFFWLGDVWADVLERMGVDDVRVHRASLVKSQWTRTVCFAGLGPGEVTSRNKKLVGISQRRTRAGALFQCSLYKRFDAPRLVSLLQLTPDEKAVLTSELEATVTDVPSLDAAALVSNLLAALPD